MFEYLIRQVCTAHVQYMLFTKPLHQAGPMACTSNESSVVFSCRHALFAIQYENNLIFEIWLVLDMVELSSIINIFCLFCCLYYIFGKRSSKCFFLELRSYSLRASGCELATHCGKILYTGRCSLYSSNTGHDFMFS